jgi:3-phosphoglycerate kinase
MILTYLYRNILMDSFLNVYADQRTMHSGRNLAAPIPTLNDLSANLSTIDLISKMGQKEEDKAFQSMEQLVSILITRTVSFYIVRTTTDDVMSRFFD